MKWYYDNEDHIWVLLKRTAKKSDMAKFSYSILIMPLWTFT